MVNINDVKKGDLLTLRGEVTTVKYPDEWGSAHVDLDNIIRVHFDSDGDIAGDIEIIGHDPKAIDEPTGLGAVVKVKGDSTGLEKYIVRVSATDSLWAFTLYPGEPHNWSSIVATHDMVEVVSTGVDL